MLADPPSLPSALAELPTPALLVDLPILERNLAAMAARAARMGAALRPHVKTHKCVEIGRRQLTHGAAGITVSTLEEARAFAAAGFADQTWALPLPLSRLAEVRELLERPRDRGGADLGLLVDSEAAVAALEEAGLAAAVWLKVDCGYHRAGVDPEGELGGRLARRIADSPRLRFAGLLTHSGQAYKARGAAEMAAAAEQEVAVTVGLAERLRAAGIAVPAVSIGSTPALSRLPADPAAAGAVAELAGVDELRPGNYAFYDYSQVQLGSCTVAECAATVLATVISCQPGAGHSVVDAGALALSKDAGPGWGPATMGELLAADDPEAPVVLRPTHPGGPPSLTGVRLTALSQEHGIVDATLPVGTRVRILPNHSCLAAACFDRCYAVEDGRATACWKVWSGR